MIVCSLRWLVSCFWLLCYYTGLIVVVCLVAIWLGSLFVDLFRLMLVAGYGVFGFVLVCF